MLSYRYSFDTKNFQLTRYGFKSLQILPPDIYVYFFSRQRRLNSITHEATEPSLHECLQQIEASAITSSLGWGFHVK
jgi:hypothetical protein